MAQKQNSTPPDSEVIYNSNNSEDPQHDAGPPKKRQEVAQEHDVQAEARRAGDGNGGREVGVEQRRTLKRQRSTQRQNLIPPNTGTIDDTNDCAASHDEQGPSWKRKKLGHEQSFTPPDTEVLDDSNDSKVPKDDQAQSRKRRRSSGTQNLTPPETELLGKDTKPSRSKSKHFVQKRRTKKHVRHEDERQEDFLTLARVDINVVSEAIGAFARLRRRSALQQADTCCKVFCLKGLAPF